MAKAKAKAKPKANKKTAGKRMKKPARKPASRPAKRAKGSAAPRARTPRSAKEIVLGAFRALYATDDWTEAKILATDPNGFDLDPGPFYEQLGAMFGVADDPDNQYFGGFGGTISATIAFIEQHWDGELHAGPDLSSAARAG